MLRRSTSDRATAVLRVTRAVRGCVSGFTDGLALLSTVRTALPLGSDRLDLHNSLYRCQQATCFSQLQATETRNFNPKSCSVCKISKPLTAYWKRAASKDGLQPACKDCQKSSIAQLRESRKDWPQYTGLLQCANCNKLRPAMEFNQRIGTLHGTQYECRACNSIRRRNVYLFRKLLGQDEHASGYNEGQTKVCRCCQSVQPRDQFYPNAGMSDGLQSYCIPCMKAKYIQRRLKSRS